MALSRKQPALRDPNAVSIYDVGTCGAIALKELIDGGAGRCLPTPSSQDCGKLIMRRNRRVRIVTTRQCGIKLKHSRYSCDECSGKFPWNRVRGIEGRSFMPGAASIIAKPVLVAELLRDLDGYENDFSLLESRGVAS